MTRRIAVVAMLLAGLTAGMAKADLTVCNDGAETKTVAIAYDDATPGLQGQGEKYISEGWWIVDPGKCSTLIAGDVTHRFIYWRAQAAGAFDGDGYFFCTTPKAFTLQDAGTDCRPRNLDEREFRQIDLGGNTSWTLTLDAAPVADQTFRPGTYGKEFSETGVFQECGFFEDAQYCDVVAHGQLHRTYAGKGTPDAVWTYLQSLPALTPVQMSGDTLDVKGPTVYVVFNTVMPAAPDPFAGFREIMQGAWKSTDGTIEMMHVRGAMDTAVYSDVTIDIDINDFAQECPDGPAGVGPVLLRQATDDDETDDQVPLRQCYQIIHFARDSLELRDTATGEMLTFVPL